MHRTSQVWRDSRRRALKSPCGAGRWSGHNKPMSIATNIASLRPLVERFPTGGRAVASEIAQVMRAIAKDDQAADATYKALVDVCAACGESLMQLLGEERLDACADEIAEHLAELMGYAEQLLAAAELGEELTLAAPKPLQIASAGADAERMFAESVGMFVGNALGQLADLEEELMSIESAGDNLDEVIASVRRTVHTIKAEFGVLNMSEAQSLCHQAETTIDAVTENEQPFPIDLMLAVCDQIKQFVERLADNVRAEFGDPEPLLQRLRKVAADAAEAGGNGGEDEPLVLEVEGDFAESLPEFVSEARSHLADAEVAMVELSSDPDNLENLNLTFRAFHTIKGVAGFLNLTPIVELAHAAETLLDGGRSQKFAFDAEDIDLVLASGDMITQLIAALEGQDAPGKRAWTQLIARLNERARRPAESGPEAPEQPDAPEQPAAAESTEPCEPEPPAAGESPAAVVTPAQPAPAQPVAAKPAPAAKKPVVKAARVERTIKVSTTRLDMLVDMVGELVIAQSMVLQDPAIQRLASQSLTRNIGQVGKITRDLQEAAMSLRMVTVKSTFQKMARLVRDVASKSGKTVRLSIAGEDTELDRNVVEQISDPLVHMIRNAIDHGIEAPADRDAVGKPQEGSLSLSAYHQGGSIVIEIADDGRGIDRDKVFEKAVSKGLIPADTNPKALSDSEVFNMIFLPGFSTAEKVTDLSGRGVGMDVVRRNIEALRGKIEIDSELGKGTTFRLRLPLTLAIIDGMIVRVGQSRYVVPTLSIEQSFRPNVEDVHHVVDRGECVHVRGAVLPIYRLKEVFAQSDGLDDLAEGILIVVEVDGQRSCLFVDEIVGQQQVVIKSLGMSRDRVVGLSGGAIMTDGRVALIVDVGTLVESVLTA
ncbi:MAG TPA: chemotaxis protein CheA [bacterium]|nr:chemotaxis protein CheA [bacterium]